MPWYHNPSLNIFEGKYIDPNPVVEKISPPVETVWPTFYYQYDIPSLAERFGREAVLESRKNDTIEQFLKRFGLAG